MRISRTIASLAILALFPLRVAQADIFDEVRALFTKGPSVASSQVGPTSGADASVVAADGSIVPPERQVMLFINDLYETDTHEGRIADFYQLVDKMRALYPERQAIVIDTKGSYEFKDSINDVLGARSGRLEGEAVTHIYIQGRPSFYLRQARSNSHETGPMLSSVMIGQNFVAPVETLKAQTPFPEPDSQFAIKGFSQVRAHLARGAQIGLSFASPLQDALNTKLSERNLPPPSKLDWSPELVASYYRYALGVQDGAIYIREPVMNFRQETLAKLGLLVPLAWGGVEAGFAIANYINPQLTLPPNLAHSLRPVAGAIGAFKGADLAYALPAWLLPDRNTMFAVKDGKIAASRRVSPSKFRRTFATTQSDCALDLTAGD